MRTALAILMLLVGAAAVFYVGWLYEQGAYRAAEESVEAPATTTLAGYFREQLLARGGSDIGRADELDAERLLLTYPGLTLALFDGVETREGRYDLASSTGELIFVPEEPSSATRSAATLEEEGYATLLERLASYLAHPAGTERQVDTLIDRIDLGERVRVTIGATASASGAIFMPVVVLEDSRCPQDVVCAQEGTLRLLLEVTADGEEETENEEVELSLGEVLETAGVSVTFVSALPLPEAGEETLSEEYVFTFRVLGEDGA